MRLDCHPPKNGHANLERTILTEPVSIAHDFVDELLVGSLVHAEDWKQLARPVQDRILHAGDRRRALSLLVENNLLTEYQASRIGAGTTFGLLLGNYRILDRLGAGGMAVVFRAEHLEMRHHVAIKVLPLSSGQDERLQSRFTNEMRIVARLRHPNIVAALDAGRAQNDGPDTTVLWYLVMEYVPGKDLEEHVMAHGALPTARACNFIYQAACALDEIHKYQLVHRDVKPSNIMITPEDQAKLLDFGLSRQLDTRMTQPGTLLGTIDFMSPEQVRDASKVDIRADIFSLGVTLYWCLTGQLPYKMSGGTGTDSLLNRYQQPPPSVQQYCVGIPPEMDGLLAKMLARNPDDRLSAPQHVMRALLPFLKPDSLELSNYYVPRERISGQLSLPAEVPGSTAAPRRVLLVDDEQGVRQFCKAVLQGQGLECDEAADGFDALALAYEKPYDLIITDVCMPQMGGVELCRRLRESPPNPHLKIILNSGSATSDEMAQMLASGADDYLIKPLSLTTLQGRALAAIRMKEAQDRADHLNRHLIATNEELARNLTAKESDLAHARNAMVLAMAKLVEHRESQTSNGARLQRMQHYCRALAQEAATTPGYAGQVNEHFIETLECCAPLHDIGKIGLPDHILHKAGKLSPEERIVMQTHTTVGGDTLRQVAQNHGFALAFLQMAADIARHHHERWDGNGYPDGLAGTAIPLAARMVTLCDVYDALRSRRSHKPALPQAAALQLMREACAGQFDPGLFGVFQRCAAEFDRVFREFPDA